MHRKVVVSGYVFASIMHEASKSENDAVRLMLDIGFHSAGSTNSLLIGQNF